MARDVTYHGPITYRAVPVAALLAGRKFPADSALEAVAVDGFVAQLPLDRRCSVPMPARPLPGSLSSLRTIRH